MYKSFYRKISEDMVQSTGIWVQVQKKIIATEKKSKTNKETERMLMQTNKRTDNKLALASFLKARVYFYDKSDDVCCADNHAK